MQHSNDLIPASELRKDTPPLNANVAHGSGDVLRGFSPTFPERFWNKVKKTDSCWIWTGCKNHHGHGQINRGVKGPHKTEMAMRASYILHFGAIPEGKRVVHVCPGKKRPDCVRPDHLGIENFNLKPKACARCGVIKSPEKFQKPAPQRGIVLNLSKCQQCRKELERERYLKDWDRIRAYHKSYREKNKEKCRAASRQSARQHYYNNWKQCRESNRRWVKKSRQHLNAYRRQRYRSEPQYAIRARIRSRIGCALKRAGLSKKMSSLKYFGCKWDVFKIYTELKFLPGMSWKNRNLWHIDHIIPLAKFDLTIESEQKMAFHYTNTQPLWAEDNCSKGSKILS